jgi:hypothetical protein
MAPLETWRKNLTLHFNQTLMGWVGVVAADDNQLVEKDMTVNMSEACFPIGGMSQEELQGCVKDRSSA